MKWLLPFALCLSPFTVTAQAVSQKLQTAFQRFESDSQLRHAISSLYVIDAKTGEVVFDKNSQVGLAGASTQKIITAATAFELLGKDYRYYTGMGYTGSSIYWTPSGDPTFGSWRYASTRPDKVFRDMADSLRKAGIKKVEDQFTIDDLPHFDDQNIPDGWIMQDIGNYYGAGSSRINWKENQYDLNLESTRHANDYWFVDIVRDSSQRLPGDSFINKISAASEGSGDNAYIYLPMEGRNYLVKGTIPRNEKKFKISGAIVNPEDCFINDFRNFLKKEGLVNGAANGTYHVAIKPRDVSGHIAWHSSPTLDSIVYWFLKKSINLYGEALIKTFANEKMSFGSTDGGTAIVRKFWKEKGLDPEELNIYDGSGLSPLNRVTTHAQVEILKYAKAKDWFTYFYDALPEYNGMKMKSGTISDVKGFCGYHKSKDGKEYIFSFLVNNYNGRTSGVVNKMYKVLDELK
ncbi:MAG: D-alanyl-D-alanine carboxypeptidase/D-alanyl-D-alanine-endopeptidase [Chitinophagaceae bacterium]